MKMKCSHCGKTIDTKSDFCEFCGESTYKQRRKRSIIFTFGVIGCVGLVISIAVGLYDLPLFKTRAAIIRYMKENHPRYHIVKEDVRYSFTTGGGFFPLPDTIAPSAYITFDEDGFEYIVHANDGKVTGDTYARHKLGYEIEKFAREGFLEPKGIENVDFYCTFDLDDDELPSKWSEYNGKFRVYLSIRGQGTTPQEVGWLWDFYKFWCNNQHFNKNWNLRFEIYYGTDPNARWDSAISIHNTDKFYSKEAWYAKKTYIPNPKPIH